MRITALRQDVFLLPSGLTRCYYGRSVNTNERKNLTMISGNAPDQRDSSPFISAFVIAYNEENSIARCIKSLKFADEVIVVDAFSTDRTATIAEENGAKVIQNSWSGFASQRNVGLKACRGRWVFFLDADEEADEELGNLLRKISRSDLSEHPQCYSIKREEYFLGKRLRFGPGNPSHQWRFFKRECVSFEGEIHEYPRFDGSVGEIRSCGIQHWPDLGIDRFLRKMNHYTTLEALDRFGQGQRTSLLHSGATFFSTFFKNGIRYQGFRNGREGFILVILESFSRVVRHLKLWTYWQVYEGKLKMNLPVRLPLPGSVKAPAAESIDKPSWGVPL